MNSNKSILDYLKTNGYNQAYDALRLESEQVRGSSSSLSYSRRDLCERSQPASPSEAGTCLCLGFTDVDVLLTAPSTPSLSLHPDRLRPRLKGEMGWPAREEVDERDKAAEEGELTVTPDKQRRHGSEWSGEHLTS